MKRLALALCTMLTTVACGGAQGTAVYDGPGGGGDPAGAPSGFGFVTLTYHGGSTWPLDRVGTDVGTVLAVDDIGDEHVQLMPSEGPTFILGASDWPRTEGPADLTAPCSQDSFTADHFDSCTFHFTEMKVGQLGAYWSTWYFHGSLAASKGGVPILTGTF
jgi:hypothetical protein